MDARSSRTAYILKYHPLIVFLVIGYLLVTPVISAQTPGPAGNGGQLDVVGGFTSRHILVRFKPDLVQQPSGKAQVRARNAPSRTRVTLTPALNRLSADWRVMSVRPAYPYEFDNPQLAAQLGLDRTFVIEVPQGTRTPDMVRAFRQQGDTVEVAEPDVIGGIAGVPNDSDFAKQWGMHNTGQTVTVCVDPRDPNTCTNTDGISDCDIDAPEAWDLHTGDLGTVTIAIIDSGVNPHAEFGNRLLLGTNTNNLSMPGLTADPVGHGTHVAGIAAAAGNNGFGVAGVTWGAKILPVRVTNDTGHGTAVHAANGLIWAVHNGANVCNMSLQYYLDSDNPDDDLIITYFKNAVNYAYAQGAVIVAAAGNVHNFGSIDVAYPARFPNCIAVTAIDSVCAFSEISNFGDEVDVCAPGDTILSTWLNNGFRFLSGTSMAAPHVSGLAALVMSYAPELSNQEVRDIIENTADDLGPQGWDSEFGMGRINAYAALLAARPPLTIMSSNPPNNAIDAGQPFEPSGKNPAGWNMVEITFSGDTAAIAAADFTVTVETLDPPSPTAPAITSIVPSGNGVTLNLDTFIPLGAWTTFTYNGSGTSTRLGFLPGDVSGNGTSNSQDILALINSLNRVPGRIRPLYATDVNRSGAANAQDITRLIDLLNGAAEFPFFNGFGLPP